MQCDVVISREEKLLDISVLDNLMQVYSEYIEEVDLSRIKNIIYGHKWKILKTFDSEQGKYFDIQCLTCGFGSYIASASYDYGSLNKESILRAYNRTLTCEEMIIKNIIE